MAVLENLEPKRVFDFFEQMCAIPHGSTNTKQMSDWLMAFARERNLEAYQDELNNVIIIKEATEGYEDAEAVILQGHMDMVCEKAPDCTKNMETEGLDLAVDGDTVYAKGTTLGGDDGIAVAMALAILDAKDIPHPRLEAVITVDEEIGMLGADGMDVSKLKGRRMLNLDSEVEGVFTVSCAGGNTTRCTMPVARAPYEGTVLTIKVGGLTGGHSGIEINKGLANSNQLCGRVLCAAVRRAELRVVSVNGGLKDNAIPRETVATVVTKDPEAVLITCKELNDALMNEYQVTDPGVFVSVTKDTTAQQPMDLASTYRIIGFLTCMPIGVQAMSADIQGLVQTSLNLGILKTTDTELIGGYCVRSSIDSQKQMLVDRIDCLVTMLGGKIEISGNYSGWQYQQNSPLRDLLTKVFTEQYGHEPIIEAIHAGVECGIFAGKLPGLDCVSLGPDLTEIHTCREKLHIASVQRLWKMLLETLKRMK